MIARALPRGPLVDLVLPSPAEGAASHARHAGRDAALVGAGLALVVLLLMLRARALASVPLGTVRIAGTPLELLPLLGSLLALGGALAVAGLGLRARLREAALVLGGVALLALSARAQILLPGTPVPVTGQTFAVLLLGAAYGWRRGFATVVTYILAGVGGLPVFAAVAGSATYGYLLGFALAAVVVGWLAERGWDRSLPLAVLAMLAGEVAIYAGGLTWLAALVGWPLALKFGLVPFLLGDALKLVAAALLLPAAWWVLGRTRRPAA